MRKFWISAAIVAASGIAGAGAACAADGNYQQATAGQGNGCDPCDPCGDGGGHGLFGHHGHKHGRFEGLSPGFNCGCNGSYKFPVPPLYTYHWPGMWQQVLMTDYHTPWRFPPLKPYVDEVGSQALGQSDGSLRRVRSASVAVESARSADSTSFSSHLEHMSR